LPLGSRFAWDFSVNVAFDVTTLSTATPRIASMIGLIRPKAVRDSIFRTLAHFVAKL